jgi:hypothetical protein
VSQFLKELGSLSLLDVAVIALMSKVLNAKSGQNINDFITKLVDGFDGDKIKAIEVFADAVKKVSTSMLILTASMLLIAGGIALLGVEIILGSIVATMAFTAGIL